MNKLLECTRGPWEATRPVARGTGHNWTIRANGTVCVAESGRWLNSDPHTESRANAALLAAAFDHALIGWALTWLRGDMWFAADRKEMGFIPEAETGEILWLPADPFGFPTLTDDLRARLIAEMEGAK